MLLQAKYGRRPVNLDTTAGKRGGEGTVYAILGDKDRVAKVYHNPARVKVPKLEAMLHNPPADPTASSGHCSIAWPEDLLVDSRGQVIGFLMPSVQGVPIFCTFHPKQRIQKLPHLTYQGLLRIGRNAASAASAIHARGHCICDINQSNALVTPRGLVSIIDCDSFQIAESQSRRTYVCEVGVPEYTPPEHQGKRYADFASDETHDRFGLAVLIWQLLMEGNHPFAGQCLRVGKPETMAERIATGRWVYDPGTRGTYRPRPASPDLNLLSPELRQLFQQCFIGGHQQPRARPDAQTWKKALERAERDLIVCVRNTSHYYGRHLKICPWCERHRRIGFESFPGVPAQGRRQPRPGPKKATTQPKGGQPRAWAGPFKNPPSPGAATTAPGKAGQQRQAHWQAWHQQLQQAARMLQSGGKKLQQVLQTLRTRMQQHRQRQRQQQQRRGTAAPGWKPSALWQWGRVRLGAARQWLQGLSFTLGPSSQGSLSSQIQLKKPTKLTQDKIKLKR